MTETEIYETQYGLEHVATKDTRYYPDLESAKARFALLDAAMQAKIRIVSVTRRKVVQDFGIVSYKVIAPAVGLTP